MKKNNPTLLTGQSTKTEKQLLTTTEENLGRVVAFSQFTYPGYQGVDNTLPSMTQPNDVMSVQQIIDKFTRGLPLNTGDIGYYDDPEGVDLSYYDEMDQFEKANYLRENRQRLQEWEQRMKDDEIPIEIPPENPTGATHPVNSSAPQEQE